MIGRNTKEPELTFVKGSGTAVTKLTLAVDRRFKKEGQQQADFINIVIWGKQAEATAQYSAKGKLISVAGRLEIRTYEKDDVKKYITEVIAEEVQFLEWKDKNNNDPSVNETDLGLTPINDPQDDIPFN